MNATAKKPRTSNRSGITSNQLLVDNFLLERKLWLQRLLDPRRDIDAECGHPEVMTVVDYRRLFDRGDIAGRVVSIWPEESWNESPRIFETEDEIQTPFEDAWDELEQKFHLYSMMQRADILSGIGRFGTILFGLDDGQDLDKIAPGIDETGQPSGSGSAKLLYLRTFDESLMQVTSLVTDVTNPRFGLPQAYQINFVDTSLLSTTVIAKGVHWSRILHLADNRSASEIFGAPRMERVLNRILDIRKVAGGSGEMFWKGGFPGLSLEALPGPTGAFDAELDVEATKKQLDAYMNGLQRYMSLVGMQAKSLGPQIADPSSHLDIQIRLIATALGVPWRVLVGSEAAQLASEQDSRAWNRRLDHRRREYLTPYLIRPFIDRMVAFGILPVPKSIVVSWPDLNSPSDKDKADIAEKKSTALVKYMLGGSDALIPPFYYLTLILGMKDTEARAIIDAAEFDAGQIDDGPREPLDERGFRLKPPAVPQGAQGNGNPTGM